MFHQIGGLANLIREIWHCLYENVIAISFIKDIACVNVLKETTEALIYEGIRFWLSWELNLVDSCI